MGLFSRKESASGASRRTNSRTTSSEAHAEDLRGRARRRLIGALALVVAAVIIVPMLVTTEPEEPAPTPVVVPGIPPMPEPGVAALDPNAGTSEANGGVIEDTEPVPAPEPITGQDDPALAAADEPAGAAPVAPEPATEPTTEPADSSQPEPATPPKPEPAPKPQPKPQAKPEPKSQISERTDDGSVAIALLEGRSPPAQAAPERGNFVLQIAAYTSEKDAEDRRSKLAAAGVTNAFVQAATSGGKPTYRLRVGPFPTRDAAQAAQTRLRALGYDNSFISSK